MLSNWFTHISFAYPWLLVLLLLIPISIRWHFRNGQEQVASFTATTTHFLPLGSSYKFLLRHWPLALRCIALCCFIIAIARPQYKFNEQKINGEGIDIVLCFDISGSMKEQDFTPNRLEASKQVASEFVTTRTGDRIGVTIFSGQSFTLCPITTDHATVLAQINNIQTGYLQQEGTAIGSGLATSVDRLRASTSKSKIVILLTDGVDFGGRIPPDIAKDMAKSFGIKVYTIGVGSNKEMEVQVQTEWGTSTQKKKLEFNESLLKNIAEETGGQYFHATDISALQNIYKSIDQLEKSKIQVTTYTQFTDEYFWWLVIGLVAVFLEVVLRLTILRKFP